MTNHNITSEPHNTGSVTKTVRVGKFIYCQGAVVWERDGLTCVRAFSQNHIGVPLQ